METYYHPKDLARFGEIGKEAPELWQKFSEWYAAVFKEGALSEREKALIALAVAHTVQCPVLHRRVHDDVTREGRDAGADDRRPCTWPPPFAVARRSCTACRCEPRDKLSM
jgi:hypothetical protein